MVLVLKQGDNIVNSIIACADAANLMSASLSGIGAVEQPTLGYYNWSSKKYQFKTFPGIYELTSLTGNIGFADGKRFTHIHVNLGNAQYEVIGGHLQNATVGATAEITFIPLPAPFARNSIKNNMRLIATPK